VAYYGKYVGRFKWRQAVADHRSGSERASDEGDAPAGRTSDRHST